VLNLPKLFGPFLELKRGKVFLEAINFIPVFIPSPQSVKRKKRRKKSLPPSGLNLVE